MIDWSEKDGAVTFNVRVVPRASRSEIVGEHDGALRVRIAAPPVDGAADEELIKTLARVLGVPRDSVEIVSDANSRLRKAILDAKAGNMPNDTIDRAVRRGTGEEEGVSYEEITYEGYGPGGAALLIESVTDNRNRTVAEIRHMFSKNGGNLAAAGAVAWMFEKKGYIVVDKAAKPEEELFEIAIEAGADDLRDDEENFEII